MHSQSERGLSFLEVLLVIAVISIVSAIAIPNLIASNRAGNAAAARYSMLLVFQAEATFHRLGGRYGTFKQMHDEALQVPPMVLSSEPYEFSLTFPDGPNAQYYDLIAKPCKAGSWNRGGDQSFYGSEAGVWQTNGTTPNVAIFPYREPLVGIRLE